MFLTGWQGLKDAAFAGGKGKSEDTGTGNEAPPGTWRTCGCVY
jgi:hypothetical protein